jgi:hypothetical protein
LGSRPCAGGRTSLAAQQTRVGPAHAVALLHVPENGLAHDDVQRGMGNLMPRDFDGVGLFQDLKPRAALLFAGRVKGFDVNDPPAEAFICLRNDSFRCGPPAMMKLHGHTSGHDHAPYPGGFVSPPARVRRGALKTPPSCSPAKNCRWPHCELVWTVSSTHCSPLNTGSKCSVVPCLTGLHAPASIGSPTALPRSRPKPGYVGQPETGPQQVPQAGGKRGSLGGRRRRSACPTASSGVTGSRKRQSKTAIA